MFLLDPDATLDFTFDWSGYLAQGETISTFDVFAADPGLTVQRASQTGATVTAWVTAGVAGTTVPLTCRITTSLDRIDDRSMTIVVTER